MAKLDDIPKKNIFPTPEGYFDKLPLQIQNRLETEKPVEWFMKPAFRMSFAAFILILIAGISFYYSRPVKYEVQKELSMLSDEDLFEYIQDNNISLVDINSELQIGEEVYNTMIKEHFSFEIEEIDVLMNLEPYTYEIL